MTAQPPLDRFLTLDDMRAIVPFYSARQIIRLESEGVFPARRLVGKRKTAWLESEVREWMQSRPRVRVAAS